MIDGEDLFDFTRTARSPTDSSSWPRPTMRGWWPADACSAPTLPPQMHRRDLDFAVRESEHRRPSGSRSTGTAPALHAPAGADPDALAPGPGRNGDGRAIRNCLEAST